MAPRMFRTVIVFFALGLFSYVAFPLAKRQGTEGASHSDQKGTRRSRRKEREHSDFGGFVTRSGTQLKLGGQPFYFTGCNFYSAMVNAAGGSHTRSQTVKVFETMQELGLTVLRTWAFNDFGVNNTWQALQKEPQVFDETVFREGLDWIISEAPKYGVRLLLVLTNYQRGYGGAWQYVHWAGGKNILEFYHNPTILGWYQKNVRTIVLRKNSITGKNYRDDPAIFGWELINEPHVPGDHTGTILNDWIEFNSAFLKKLDSNHLVGVGVEGFYGQSTPARLVDNPVPNLSAFANGGKPAPYAPICEGQDFAANHRPKGIDFSSIHIYPDFWATGNITFQMAFTAQYVRGHMREAEKLRKPLIISEFGKYPPLAHRNMFLSYIYDTATASAAAGGVLAGTMVWTLGTSPEFPYVHGYDGFNIYNSREAYEELPPSGYIRPTELAVANAENEEFYGWAELTKCNNKYAAAPHELRGSPSRSSGWDETISIIKQAAAATSKRRRADDAGVDHLSLKSST